MSKELYFHEVVWAKTLAHTLVVSVLSISVLFITGSTMPEWERTVAPVCLVQVSINYREDIQELLAASDWCLLPGGPVDAIAWKRPPREYSCPNS